MAVKLNLNRTHIVIVPVPVTGPNGEDTIQTFRAECSILKREHMTRDTPLINELLVAVHDLDLLDDQGRLLDPAATLEAVRADNDLASLIIQAWKLGNDSRLTKSRTYLEQLKS